MNAVAEQYALEVNMDNEVILPRSFLLDHFDGTTKEHDVEYVKQVLGGEWVPTKPTAKNYELAETNGAITVMWAPKRDHLARVKAKDGLTEMGVHVHFPGGSNPTKFYEKIVKLQLMPSRFDLAFDTDQFDMAYVWDAWCNDRIQCIIRSDPDPKISARELAQGKTPSSLFWKGEKIECICYDKAKEQGIEGLTWTRIEYRFRGDRAKQVWSQMSQFIKHCHKVMRIMKRKYASMSLGKLDDKFAACVSADRTVADNVYAKLIIMSPSQAIARSKAHLKRLLSWVKTHLCADPQMLSELVNASVKQDLLARLLYELSRLKPDLSPEMRAFAKSMQGGGLGLSLTPQTN